MKETEAVVSARSVSKVYERNGVRVEVLRGLDLTVEKGEFTVISGPSGSGKTTLLNVIGGIDKPTTGRITVLGESLEAKSENFLASFRCDNIGFVFQSYNLVSTLTVAENVAFPMEWARKADINIKARVQEVLDVVGLLHREDHFPYQLSGGEQQRVAFARAIANDPPLLLVDEPTGNLDMKTSGRIIQVLSELKDQGKTIIVATHDEQIRNLAHQRQWLEEGRLTSKNE